MKLKRLMAASMAGIMAVSSAIVCEISAGAAETVLYEYDDSKAGQITNASFTEEALAALKNATESFSITVDGEGDSAYFYPIETTTWKSAKSNNPTVTVTKDHEFWTNFKAASGVRVDLGNYTVVNKITVTIDDTDTFTIFDLSTAPKGMSFPKDGYSYPISADDLANAGVTADNIAESKLVVTFESVGENKELALLASSGNWENQFYWSNTTTVGEMELPLTGEVNKVAILDKPLTTGILLSCKDSVVSKIAISTPDSTPVESVEITLSDGTAVGSPYTYGDTINLKANVTPADADGADKVEWASENPTVATVDENGKVTLLKAGEAKITAIAGDVSHSVFFTVNKKKLSPSPTVLDTLTVTDNNVEEAVEKALANFTIRFFDDNTLEDVSLVKGTDFTVSDPQISADKKSYSITIELIGDAADRYELSQTMLEADIAYKLSSIELNHETLNLVAGADGRQLTVETIPDSALLSNLTIAYKSSDPNVATVDKNGLVTPVKAGTATITVTATAPVLAGGLQMEIAQKTATCAVTVTDMAIPATNIALDAYSKTMSVGDKAKLTATVKPTDTTDKVVWTSSNEKVATVDANGNITALAVGTTKILATAGTVSAECTVTVEAVKVTEVKLDKTAVSLKAGETAQLTATVLPDNAADKTVTWTSSSEKVATVVNGKITAVAAGTATITATAGGKSATCTVTVTKAAQNIKDTKKYPSIPKDYAKIDPAVTTVNSDGTKNMLIMFSISEDDAKNFRGARITFKRADGKTFSRSLILGTYYTDVTYVKDGDNYNGSGQNYIVFRLTNVQDSWGDISVKFELINGLG